MKSYGVKDCTYENYAADRVRKIRNGGSWREPVIYKRSIPSWNFRTCKITNCRHALHRGTAKKEHVGTYSRTRWCFVPKARVKPHVTLVRRGNAGDHLTRSMTFTYASGGGEGRESGSVSQQDVTRHANRATSRTRTRYARGTWLKNIMRLLTVLARARDAIDTKKIFQITTCNGAHRAPIAL